MGVSLIENFFILLFLIREIFVIGLLEKSTTSNLDALNISSGIKDILFPLQSSSIRFSGIIILSKLSSLL